MATCTTQIDNFSLIDANLDVSKKYIQLMTDTIEEGSLYERVKDTLFELFKELNVSESEKLQLVANNISQLTISLSAQAMSTAIAWSKEERDGAYDLALKKAQIQTANAQKTLTEEEICKTIAIKELTEAQKTETLASTTRQDSLANAQKEQSEAERLKSLSETFREYGIVTIGASADGEIRGISGDNAGYKYKHGLFLDRQKISFEDSKRTHAVNAASQLMGQLLSAEIPITENSEAFLLFKTAMDYLTNDYVPTP